MFSFLSWRQVKKHRKRTEHPNRRTAPSYSATRKITLRDDDGKPFATITIEDKR